MKTIGTVKTVIEVEDSEVEQVIKEFYGHEYETVPMEEWSNDSTHSFNVSKKEKLGKSDAATIRALKKGKPEKFSLYIIMQDLVNKRVIPPGEYNIEVCW